MANKIKYGLRNVYYAKETVSGSTVTYATPVAMLGAVSVTLSAEGDETKFYADDIVYFSTTANNGYSGDLEISLIEKAFRKDILGEVEDSNGALVENADALPASFALGFEVQGDEQPRRMWLYNCTVSRPNQDASTKEASITPQTAKLSIKAMPRVSDRAVKVAMEKSAQNVTAFNSFFTAVYEATTSV